MSDQIHVTDDLAAYALGALETSEYAPIEAHLDACDECRLALAILEESLSQLPASLEVEQPSPALRVRVLESAGVAPASKVPRVAIVPPPPDMNSSGQSDRSQDPIPISSRRRGPVWTAAIGIAAAVLVIGSAVLVHNSMNSHNTVTAAQQYLNLVKAAQARGDTVTTLKPPPGGALSASAAVAISAAGKASLIIGPSKPAPPGKVYQLWWLNTPADAVSAGVYSADKNTAVEKSLPTNPGSMTNTAVTVEPGPIGSDTPTTNPVISSPLHHA